MVPVEKIPEVGIKLLRLGLCCTVEKPLGASIHDVQALLDAARTTQTPNMVSVNRRFMPFLNRAIEWTAKSGPLRYVRCTFTRHQRTEPEFLWGTAVHAVDALRHIAGDVAEAGIRTLLPVLAALIGTPSTCALTMELPAALMSFLQQVCWMKRMSCLGKGFRRL